VASFAFGILLLVAPLLGVVTPGWWIGLYALIFGVISLIRMFEVRRVRDKDVGLWQGRRHAAPQPG
jgi:uncharacterized membrane protein HdeD (DUF308 family)